MKDYKLKFKIGETVYIKTDREQKERKVDEIRITKHGVAYGVKEINQTHYGRSWHAGFELSTEKWHLKRIATND